jgi:hypothetical protein
MNAAQNTPKYRRFPHNENIEAALDKHFDDIRNHFESREMAVKDKLLKGEAFLYKIDDAFGISAEYWNDWVQPTCFLDENDARRILYRPKVTDELFTKVQETSSKHRRKGVIVTGPRGIGKSHTLVNLVLKLQWTGDYLVTFVPDCMRWNTEDFLLRMICQSFGATPYGPVGVAVGDPPRGSGGSVQGDFHLIIKAIAQHVTRKKKQWVFIFDKIDMLFAKEPGARTISSLRFPFYMVERVLSLGAMSIVSDPPNNDDAQKYPVFREFRHTSVATEVELAAMFGTDAVRDVVKEVAGASPYYVKKLLAEGERGLLDMIYEKVEHSIIGLRRSIITWPTALDTILYSVLALERGDVSIYDSAYLAAKPTTHGWLSVPIIPTVHAAYRRWLWKEIMDVVAKKEALLLFACGWQRTTNDTRDRIFKHVVIQRIMSSGLTFSWENIFIQIDSGDCLQFPGSGLPPVDDMLSNVMYVPDSPTFPLVDLLVRCGSILCGIQARGGTHEPVSSEFLERCNKAGWFSDAITEVVLIVLSPDDASKQQGIDLISDLAALTLDDSVSARIHVVARSCSEFEQSCLSTIPWPRAPFG